MGLRESHLYKNEADAAATRAEICVQKGWVVWSLELLLRKGISVYDERGYSEIAVMKMLPKNISRDEVQKFGDHIWDCDREKLEGIDGAEII